MLNKIRSLGLCALLSVSLTASVFADEIALRPDHPNRYVVVKGDTLWDISARFLESPWRWPEVWSFNPQIENPHLIYPGDVVALVYDESGKPMLRVERGLATVKFSPKVRATRVDKPISSIPLDAISQFLGKPRIVTKQEINNAAYVIAGTENRIIAGEGDIVYARGIVSGGDTEFTVLRIGDPYRNPGARRGDILGYRCSSCRNHRTDGRRINVLYRHIRTRRYSTGICQGCGHFHFRCARNGGGDFENRIRQAYWSPAPGIIKIGG